MDKKRLGRGLGALLDFDEENDFVQIIDITKITPSESQPRKYFNDNSLKELAESIKNFGILSPIIVKPENGKFKIISGERRYRAAKIAGLNEIPVIIKDEVDEKTSFEISLIENLQREDLNPIEEAEGFKRLIEDFSYTHQQIAELIGRDRSYVTNILRLLKLSEFVKSHIASGEVTPGHAKVLVSLPEDMQNRICEMIIAQKLSVREVEKLVQKLKENNNLKKRENVVKELILNEFKDYFYNLSKKLNTKLDIDVGKREKGKLIIHFKNKGELKKILEIIYQRGDNDS